MDASIYKDRRIVLLVVRSRMWKASSESPYGDELDLEIQESVDRLHSGLADGELRGQNPE